MFEILLDGRVMDICLAWDKNDAWVYGSRRWGCSVTVRRVAP